MSVETVEILREAAARVYENIRGMAGTADAAGDFGVGAGGDISRRIDIVAEKTVLDCLRERNLDCTVLGEECGRVRLSESPNGFVIMDAIDGSANAVRGVPFFCCSLAFATHDRLSSITDAVVADLTNGDQYWASEGKGAYLNEERIRTHGADPIYRIVGINTSGLTPGMMERLQPVFEQHNHTRHFGANALEMSMVASGLMDILIDLRCKIRVLDLAAGYLIVREAGGLVLDGSLDPLDSDLEYTTKLSFFATANRKILDGIMAQINRQ